MKHQNIALFAALFAAWNCKIGISSKFASTVIFFKTIPSIG